MQRIWNSCTTSPLPKCLQLSKKREASAEARWLENPSEGYWRTVVGRIEASSFCRGGGPRKWVADFDFLIRPDSAGKVLEGKYDDRGDPPADDARVIRGEGYDPYAT